MVAFDLEGRPPQGAARRAASGQRGGRASGRQPADPGPATRRRRSTPRVLQAWPTRAAMTRRQRAARQRQRAHPVRSPRRGRLPAGDHHPARRRELIGHGRHLGRPPLCPHHLRAAVLRHCRGATCSTWPPATTRTGQGGTGGTGFSGGGFGGGTSAVGGGSGRRRIRRRLVNVWRPRRCRLSVPLLRSIRPSICSA